MRAAKPSQMADRPPVVVEWVDRAERIAQTLPKLDELVPNALITLETVQVYRAVLRQRGPFAGEATAGTIMHPLAVTVTPETMLSEALALMIAQRLSSLPVLNAEERLIGMLLERDLAYRVRLNIPLALIELLDQQARDVLLTPLVGRTVAELMTGEPRSVSKGMAIPQALVLMIEQGYDQIAVLDRDGRVVGMLGSDDALRASLEANTNAVQGVRDAEPPTPVNLVMQTNSATIRIDQAAAVALELLLQAPQRQFAVIETDGRLIGVLTLEQVLRRLSPADLAVFSMALVRGELGAATPLTITSLQELIEQEPQTLAPTDTVVEATRRLLEGGLASAPVVDSDGRFVGTLTRGSLVRALVQQSE
jgi:CBS domain-containing protein